MKKIYTSIDIGSDNIKVVCAEINNNNLYILSSVSLPSEGIKKGLIVDAAKTMISIKSAISKTENILGVKVNKIIASIPSNNAIYSLVESSVSINEIVTGDDINNLLKKIKDTNKKEDYEIVNIFPINFMLDDNIVSNPKNCSGQNLYCKAIMVSVPNLNVYSVCSILSNLNIEVVDITFNSIADYYSNCDIKNKEQIVGIINIGNEKTEVSVFNKGIIMNSSVINMGDNIIDIEISEKYNINLREVRSIKEKFINFNKRFAKINEKYSTLDINGDKIKLNQYELSNICMNKIIFLIKKAKNVLKDLTNKEISSIIITGGCSDATGFSSLLNEISSNKIKLSNINYIGARENKYSSCIGMIKYFDDKLLLRDTNYPLLQFDNNELSSNKDNKINKFFGYFLDK